MQQPYQKCHILVATQALVHFLICPHLPSGAARPWACAYISGNALLPVLQLLHVAVKLMSHGARNGQAKDIQCP